MEVNNEVCNEGCMVMKCSLWKRITLLLRGLMTEEVYGNDVLSHKVTAEDVYGNIVIEVMAKTVSG